jgi:lysosomal acid lipase/cholesteryl ester hydrolase
LLADKGYDVWLGNTRGNFYSKRHVSLSARDRKFWQWYVFILLFTHNRSWDDSAWHDVPASINYILTKTGASKLAYVGHSQGATFSFACFTNDECTRRFKNRVAINIALAPVVEIAHPTSAVLEVLAKLHVDKFFDIFGMHDFLPSTTLMRMLMPHLCEQKIISRAICSNMYCALAGCDSLMSNVNMTRLAQYFSHIPAGTSVHNVQHWAQLIRSKSFRKFDYGESVNLQMYHRQTPPEYNLGNMKFKTFVAYGGKDVLADSRDVNTWLPKVGNLIGKKYIDHYGQ